MHYATRCCDPWRVGTVVGALMLLAPGAQAGDTNALAPTPPHVAACTHAATFRTVVDVGHGTQAPGALSARGVDEYDFNLALAREIDKELRAAGFAKTVLMVTPEKPHKGLFKRVHRANDIKADLFFAIHHDSVPDPMLETWQVDGKTRHYNDRFPGHSIFISNGNADPAGSLAFAKSLGLALKSHGLKYTPHYTEKFMKTRRRELVDAQAGVYRYDQLIVLKDTRMPAALLEAGSIVNRDEELLLATPEHQSLMASAAVEAVDAFCVARTGGPVVAKKHDDGPQLARHDDAPKAAKQDDAPKKDEPKSAKKRDEGTKMARRTDEAHKKSEQGWLRRIFH
jgi:N-acetylmuramoyl-L-alanine amidase